MHGHPVLEKMGMQYHVYCSKIQSVEREISQEEVYSFLDKTNNLNQGYYPYYTAPYWVSGLNIETWMTILFTDVNRSFFKVLQKVIERNLNVYEMAPHFIQNVNLKEKFILIEEFQTEFSTGNFKNLEFYWIEFKMISRIQALTIILNLICIKTLSLKKELCSFPVSSNTN